MFDNVDNMPAAYDPATNAADKHYSAGNAQKVSPLILFMFYWHDSYDYEAALMKTTDK